MLYEIFYLIGASKEAELENIKGGVEKIVTDAGGEFLEKETREKRRLSYTVKKENHGIYIARRFELENPENLKEITSKLNLNGNVLRFILSKADELPELKSKEERINESSRKETFQRDRKIAVEKNKKEPEKQNEAEEKIPEKTESVADSNDIDKKLEEILNI